jgi:hypothetical protein
MKIPRKPPTEDRPKPRTGWGAHPYRLARLLGRRSTVKPTLPVVAFLSPGDED